MSILDEFGRVLLEDLPQLNPKEKRDIMMEAMKL